MDQGFASKPFVVSQIMLIDPPLKLKLSVSMVEIPTLSDKCENNLPVSNLHKQHIILHGKAQTFNYKETHFWLEVAFNVTPYKFQLRHG